VATTLNMRHTKEHSFQVLRPADGKSGPSVELTTPDAVAVEGRTAICCVTWPGTWSRPMSVVRWGPTAIHRFSSQQTMKALDCVEAAWPNTYARIIPSH